MNEHPKHTAWEELVRLAVLIWSAGMLTASYAGMLDKMDPTFIASLLSGTLAGYGISRMDPKTAQQKPPSDPQPDKPSPPPKK
jgi:hypothetical protein